MEMTFNIFTHILEDDPDLQEDIEVLLEEHGLKEYCHFYHDPQKFLNVLGDEMSIVVIDHFLPLGLTGLHIIKAVKEKNKYNFAIVMTGQRSKDIVEEYVNAGADRYIDKEKPDYKIKLMQYLKVGFAEVKERIEYVRFKNALRNDVHKTLEETNELLNKLKVGGENGVSNRSRT